MRIKYSPQKAEHDTVIKIIDKDTISIDGIEDGFDNESLNYPGIATETDCRILEAHRENGELHLTVLRKYTSSCSEWDDGQYHEVKE